MPDRYLRDALLWSDLFDALSIEARELFVRLMLVADDFGCFDGRDHVIGSACYPLKFRDCTMALNELHNAGLIVRYSNRGKGYLAIMQWGEILRARPRKFPAPPVMNDRPKIKYRGAYNRPMSWENPEGCDDVSVLIDLLGRAVLPQPPEWRRAGDLMPLTCSAVQQGTLSLEYQALERAKPCTPSLEGGDKPRAPSLGTQALLPAVAVTVTTTTTDTTTKAVAAADDDDEKPKPWSISLMAQAPPKSNGKIELQDNGEWHGLSEAQEVRWQSMFHGMSVPDQIARAGAWLLAHPEERAEYARTGEQEQFLIRWLLREAKPV